MEVFKNRVRALSRFYLRKGFIDWKPCKVCESFDSEMHHADYAKPLQVEWLCRQCHADTHVAERHAPKPLKERKCSWFDVTTLPAMDSRGESP